jgi:hypothetical protein
LTRSSLAGFACSPTPDLGKFAELWYRDSRAIRVVSVPPGSLLGEVAKVAATLSDHYRWNLWDATCWVVAGGDPPIPWVFRWKPELRRGAAGDTTTRLVIEVDPTLTPAEVTAAYGRARSAIFRGARLRPLDEKAQALVQFALDHGSGDGEPPWEDWRRLWNAGFGGPTGTYSGEDHGPGSKWRFRRDLRSAWRRFTRVGWGLPV